MEVLCYRGDVRHTLCVALDRYLQQLLQQPDLHGFVVDLTAVVSIDSTNLGILARLARAMRQAALPRVTLISNQPDINELLEAVGFYQEFTVVESLPTTCKDLDELRPLTHEGPANGRLLLEAHRALMNLNEQNRARFRDVVKAFEEELKS